MTAADDGREARRTSGVSPAEHGVSADGSGVSGALPDPSDTPGASPSATGTSLSVTGASSGAPGVSPRASSGAPGVSPRASSGAPGAPPSATHDGPETRGGRAPGLPAAVGDARRLDAFLRDAGVLDEPVDARPIGDGHSNLTSLLTGTRTGATVVLRRPPDGAAAGAHDVLREARFMAALADTPVPVPRVLATAPAGDPLDVPCFVMDHVAGPVVTDRTTAPLDTPDVRHDAGLDLADVLAALHAVDHRAVGLGDVGRPEGFPARHVRRMARLVALPDGSLPPEFAALSDRLLTHAPEESDATIVHGDFRLGNVVLAPETPGRVAAVLDWELATVGDPLFDVAYLLASIPDADEPRTPTQQLAAAFDEPGWPSRADVAARYVESSGRSLDGLGWYTAASLWKLATLYEYSRRRGVDPYYRDPALVRSFLDAARRTADQEGL